MTQVWFRNPHNYIRELVECGPPFNIVWDRGILVKKRIEPVAHAKLYLGSEADFDILAVGTQGSAHLDKNHTLEKPKGVYPTWEYGENFNILEEMVSSPIGMDAEACMADVPKDERPVVGQDHIVVVTNLPNAQLSANRPFYRHLRELQEEYADCTILLHGMYSYRIMFGMGFAAADIEPRTAAANGKVVLPNGKELAYARTVGQMQWVNLLGMSITDLKVPRSRCIFNIRGARWAGEHFNDDIKFKTQGKHAVDPDSTVATLPTTNKVITKNNFEVTDGDMITCDTCSLQDNCKFYRDGAVCSLPGSETSALTDAFQSRNGSKIIDGLGSILAAQSRRLERGMESEEEFGELDPEVTKIMNQLFTNAAKLAKLVDPSLTKPMIQQTFTNGGAVAGANPKELMAAVVRQLESEGHSRADMTPEMVLQKMASMAGFDAPPQAIQGKVVNG